MKRYLILFCLCLSIGPRAYAQDTQGPPAPIRALLEFCLPAIANNEDPADVAVRAQLAEFSPEQAKNFSPQGGRVFAIPYALGDSVLITNNNYAGMCSIAVRQTDKAVLFSALDKWSGASATFKLRREKRLDDEYVTRREYAGDIGGPIAFLVSVSDTPRENGMQALMTIARVQKESP